MACVTISIVLLLIVVTIAEDSPLLDETPTAETIKPIIVGDIRFHPDTFDANNHPRSGIIGGRNSRWPNGIVTYEVDPGFSPSEREIIQSAMNEISNKTCIRFIVRTTEKDWIFILRDLNRDGCWSWMTKIGGKQILNLQTPGCVYRSTIAHELIHAIGFAHEQSRPDRDSFVNVHWDNIVQGQQGNFVKYGSNVVTTFGVPYDLKSIMHYGQYDFSKDRRRLPTITSKTPGQAVTAGNEVSPYDIQKINAMYRGICTGSVPAPKTPLSYKTRARRPAHGK